MAITKPDDLSPLADQFWDSVVMSPNNAMHSPTEWVILALGCKWLTSAESNIAEAKSVPAGIATDKFMLIASKFGFTPADREKAGVAAVKPKAAPRRKRSADELTPQQISQQLSAIGLPQTTPTTPQLPGMSDADFEATNNES